MKFLAAEFCDLQQFSAKEKTMRTDSMTLTLDGTNDGNRNARKSGIARVLTACAIVAAVALPCASRAGDVFSDAKSWHQGFVDANGDGIMNVGKTEFPESLLLAEPDNAAHNVTVGTL